MNDLMSGRSRRGTFVATGLPADVIGRAGDGREICAFPIPTTPATMHRIIRGPRGRMWFTELATDEVGYSKRQA